MKHLVTFTLEDGSTIVVETEEPEAEPTTRGLHRPGEVNDQAKETFEQALSKVRPATEKVITLLRSLAHQPDEIEMEFGFSFSAAAGVVITSVGTAANYRVTLRWKHEAAEKQE